ncbi:hypothetical protein [Nocardioides sp. SYSU DS0651]|uniref:hypothetical protein n=1 Tax=Nocardioides sp. SYSU DS0651 TaxID=3415955 RepID=UPI003F4B7381
MSPTELRADDLPPPRRVTPATTVTGHRITVDPDGSAWCTCRAEPAAGQDPEAWRDEHLAHVWPIFVPRSPDESLAEWIARITAELQRAQSYEGDLGGPMVAISADGEDLGVSVESLLIAGRIAGLRRELVLAMTALH